KKDPYGKIYGFKDRLTILRVTIDSDGNLKRLETVKECGLDFLDIEAVKAFKEAQPFHNPPKGLLDEHGLITFNFGFLFEISSSRFKFFYQDPGY
ncbi:MAG: energy transducer TonB, partial [Deltaproteobacteria bacterium]|nr:energy transducer TonB [Deltaproteobacteria bacterium]